MVYRYQEWKVLFLKEQVYFGTYTKKESKGIYSAFLDTQKGEVSTPTLSVAVQNPTYLTMVGDTLLTIAQSDQLGGIASYDISESEDTLIDDVLEKGPNPCYVAYDAKRNLIFSANYHTAQIKVYRLEPDKTLKLCDTVTHFGFGPKKEQQSSHIHYTDLTPDGRLVAVDLGNDTVVTYDVTDKGKITPVALLKLPAGFGPRHLVFSPKGTKAYLVGELSSQVAVLDYDQKSGEFSLGKIYKTIPEDFDDHNGAAAIKLSSDGKFLYISNRGHNSLVVFKVLEDSLELIQHVTTYGDFPRDFALDPTEEYVLVANQNTNDAFLYTRDNETGKLACCQKNIPLPEGVCVYFK